MNRREFLKSSALTAVAVAAMSKLPGAALSAAEAPAAGPLPDLVAVRNGTPAEMFRKGIEALGGMKAFVKPGQKVVVKPNIGWDKKPEEAANTNPELVAEIVRQALAAGASEVTVFDHTCNEWQSCYKNSGIAAAVTEAGGKVLPANLKEHYSRVERPEAVKMKNALIHNAILEADVFINVPVLKHHGGAKMSCAMKNFMGLVEDRGFMHRNDLQQCIADAVLYRKPDLNVVDAYRIVTSNGPRGVTPADVKTPKYQLLSRDIVAVDTMAARIIGFPLESIPHLKLGEKLGYGTMDTAKLKIARIDA